MNRRRALIGWTLTVGLLLGLGLIDLLDLPSWRVQASHGSPGNQAVRPRAAKAEAATMLAPQATITVNSTTDGAPANNGACTLREALMNANGANQSGSTDCTAGSTASNTIIFNLPAGPQTISLTGALPDITRSLSITGPGARLLTVRRTTGGDYRIFTISIGGLNIAISGLTISNGYFRTLRGSGGGIRSFSNLTLTDCAITGNTSYGGGGVSLEGADGVFSGCTFSSNGSYTEGGGIIFAGNTLRLNNCTISGNNGDSWGGGIYNNGNTLEVTNCTIANNAQFDTESERGSGIYTRRGTTRLRNTIIANTNLPNLRAIGSETYIISLGNNLTSDDGGSYLNQPSDKIHTNPLLGPLGNYGGPTETHALLPGSPAINAGNNCVTANNCASNNLGFNLTTDQRGVGFNRQVGSAVDIGAFESRGFTLAVAGGNNQSTGINTAFTNPLSVTVTPVGAGEPVNGGRVTFTPPVSGASATVAGNPATVSNGVATTGTVTANATAGSYQVAASAIGATAALNFGLTNVLRPDIAVFNGASTAPADERASNVGTYTLPNTIVGNTSAAQTFTIKNVGMANLTGIAITLTGANPGDFTLNTSGVTSLAPNATRTFTVSFRPTALGVRNAVVRIASNDPDENPFLINISGTGVNSPPTITAGNLNRDKGSSAFNVQIATATDAQDAEQNLVVTVNGAASATVNGVTINTLTVTAGGLVRASVSTTCTATNTSFTLTVRDTAGATANATLTVTLLNDLPPTVGNYPNTLVAPGGTTTVTPSSAPSDQGGSIASVTATATPDFFTGTLTANTATGAVTITGANPMNSYQITVTVTDNCGQTTTRTFTLTVNDCGASLSKTGQNFAANGGTGNFTVTINSGCTWTAVSNHPSFITVTAPAGTVAGTQTVSFSVASHSNPTPRTGTITVAGQTFTVRQGAQFTDVPLGASFYEEIGKLSAVGVTQGCGGGNYCPDSNVSRDQMAAFLSRALGVFNPPAPATQRYADVPPENSFYAFIEEMAVRQITLGCGNGNYCPTNLVTREQMAAFIIRALHAPGYVPPTNVPQRFADVPPSNIFYGHIEEMAVRGITLGCGGGNYCPTDNVTRAAMAAFLVRAFNL